jgi:hypothetical protein
MSKSLGELVRDGVFRTNAQAAEYYVDMGIPDWEEIEQILHWMQTGRKSQAEDYLTKLVSLSGSSGATQSLFLKLQGLGLVNGFRETELNQLDQDQISLMQKRVISEQKKFRYENQVDRFLINDINDLLSLIENGEFEKSQQFIAEQRQAYKQGYSRAGNLLTRLVALDLIPNIFEGQLTVPDQNTIGQLRQKIKSYLM